MISKGLLFHLYWGVALIVLPLFLMVSNVGLEPGDSRDHLFVLMTAISVILFGFFHKDNDWVSKTVSLVLLLIAGFSRTQFHSLAYRYEFACVITGIVLFSQMRVNLSSYYIKILTNCFIISSAIQVVTIFIGEFGIDPYPIMISFFSKNMTFHSVRGIQKAVGTFGNSNYVGPYVAMAVPFVYEYKKWLAIPFVIAVFLTSSMPSLSLLAAGFCIAWMIKFDRKYIRLLALILTLVAVIGISLALQETIFHDSGRFKIWLNGMKLFDLRALFVGNGLGFIYDAYTPLFLGPHPENTVRSLHNEYFDFMHSFGLLGYLSLGFFFWQKAKSFINAKFTFLFAFLVMAFDCFGHFFFHISGTALIGIIILSYIIRGEEWA